MQCIKAMATEVVNLNVDQSLCGFGCVDGSLMAGVRGCERQTQNLGYLQRYV